MIPKTAAGEPAPDRATTSPATTRVLHRQIHHAYPIAVAGEGVHVVDRTGKRYIDASGGAAVSCLGHGHPVVAEAMKAQIDRLAFAYGQFFASEAGEELAEMLIADAPAGLSHVYYGYFKQ